MIERRGNSWRARYHGPDGRERNKTFQRKSDAERWLSQQRSFIAHGDWTDPVRGRVNFGEYALAWLDSRTDLKLKTAITTNRCCASTSRRPGRRCP